MVKTKQEKTKEVAKKRSSLFGLFFLLAFILGLLVGIKLIQQQPGQADQLNKIIINKQTILVEIADSQEETYQGLSDRQSLPANQGMLFTFDQPGNYPFVMRRMNFSLDFVFILDNQITELVENVPYPQEEEQPVSIIAAKKFNQVLEIPAGSVKKWGIKVGDRVSF